MGSITLNDTDEEANNEVESDTDASSKAFRGTRLLDKNANSPRKPTTKKRKQAALAEAITEMATQQAKASTDVAAALREMTKAFCVSEQQQ